MNSAPQNIPDTTPLRHNFIDRTGQKFHRLTVIGYAGKVNGHRTGWRCRCDCGNEVVVESGNLVAMRQKSCGCALHQLSSGMVDITGRKFGRFTVIEYAETKNKKARWLCRCDCGTERVVCGSNLRTGESLSCGCLRDERVGNAHRTHGMSGSREHSIWRTIKDRCNNPNNKSYEFYGKRGITICKKWSESFEAFISDMGMSPSVDHSVDRIENSKGYEPGNCKWATRIEQSNNTRRNRLVTVGGVTKTVSQWCRELNLRPGIIFNRLNRGVPPEEALELVHSFRINKSAKPKSTAPLTNVNDFGTWALT